jgi:hypothetical protein
MFCCSLKDHGQVLELFVYVCVCIYIPPPPPSQDYISDWDKNLTQH